MRFYVHYEEDSGDAFTQAMHWDDADGRSVAQLARCRSLVSVNLAKNPRIKSIEFPELGVSSELPKALALASIALFHSCRRRGQTCSRARPWTRHSSPAHEEAH